jgi:hypothetical protein
LKKISTSGAAKIEVEIATATHKWIDTLEKNAKKARGVEHHASVKQSVNGVPLPPPNKDEPGMKI